MSRFGASIMSLLVGVTLASCLPSDPGSENPSEGIAADQQACFGDFFRLQCEEYEMTVTLSPDDPTEYTLVGELCHRGSVEDKTLQVLLSGGTYGPSYWDFPYASRFYSYVHHATFWGYATFNLSRIGIAGSDHPPSHLVTVDSSAYTVHQVLQGLRSGDVTGVEFGRIILVGHSLGSITSVATASQFPGDVDGVILTGFLHNMNPDPAFWDMVMTSFWLADWDPKFAGMGLDMGYSTSIPGLRGQLFYYEEMADPDAIAADEETKETGAIGESDAMMRAFSPESAYISVPVLTVVGDRDSYFCGGLVDCSDEAAVSAHEALWFSPLACHEARVIPHTGHVNNLHYTAPATYAAMLSWAGRRVGYRSDLPPFDPCVPEL